MHGRFLAVVYEVHAMPLRNLAWLLIVPGFVLVGLAICYSAPAPDRDYKLLRQVVDVLAEVDSNYVKELSDEDREKFVESMINGGLHDLDPHSEYLNADKRKQFESDSEGSFGGVGITLGTDAATKLLKVSHPMPGTPAFEKGVIAGDFIPFIGTTPTNGMTTTEAAKLIKGKIGTTVTLTIRRAGRDPADQQVTLTRAAIEMHPVLGVRRRTDDPLRWEWFADPAHKIALIRIKGFSELTAGTKDKTGELPKALEEIKAAGGRALILDLRENPGGLLSQSAAVVDLFIPEGQRIVSTRDRRGSERKLDAKIKKDFDLSTEEGRQKERQSPTFVPVPGDPRPMVVLINKGSASASEIVAAALQDHGRAVVVGERSYGKGSVQKLFNLSGGAAVKLTTETYWRPSGKNIDRPRAPKENPDEWGVKPNPGLEVAVPAEDRLRYGLEVERLDWIAGRADVVGPNPPKQPPAEQYVPLDIEGKPIIDVSKPYEDRPLTRAVEYLRKQLSGVGQAAPRAVPPVFPRRVDA
jgi:carboxyl-terminal processing protease